MVVNNPNGMIGWRQITKDIFHGEMLSDMIFGYLAKRFDFDNNLITHDEKDETVTVGNMITTLGEAESILEAMRSGALYNAQIVAVGSDREGNVSETVNSMLDGCNNLGEILELIDPEDLEEAIRVARDNYRTNRDTLGFYLQKELELMLLNTAGDKDLFAQFTYEYRKWWKRDPTVKEFAYHIAAELKTFELFYKTFPEEKSPEMQVPDYAFYSDKNNEQYLGVMLIRALDTMKRDGDPV